MAIKRATFDLARIIDYENGELTHEQTVELFQHLVDSGLAWQLQGHYGRRAIELIENGEVYSAAEDANDPA